MHTGLRVIRIMCAEYPTETRGLSGFLNSKTQPFRAIYKTLKFIFWINCILLPKEAELTATKIQVQHVNGNVQQ